MAGKVILVGAGPGDAGLLTVKGRQALKQAEVVVYDRLVDQEILKLIPAKAQRIDVGKRAGEHPVPQHEINRILLEKAREGHRVVRLKGGDCFVFGRGGEELELLSERGVDFEVIPGITSALAAAAYAGIPATHRDFCASVHIITGHRRRDEALKLDFDALVRLNGTLIFLMAVATFGEIAQGLMQAGMPGDMPCAIVENGTRPEQRRLLTTVAGAEACVRENAVVSPAIFVVGRVCALSDRMDWFDALPLKGVRVLVGMCGRESVRLAELLRMQGARVIELPAPEVEYLPFELPAPPVNLVLNNHESVYALLGKLRAENKDARALAGYRLVCRDASVAQTLREVGLIPDALDEKLPEAPLCLKDGEGIPVWQRVHQQPMEPIEADFVALAEPNGMAALVSAFSIGALKDYRLVCPTQRLKGMVARWFREARSAEHPTPESLIECMQSWMKE